MFEIAIKFCRCALVRRDDISTQSNPSVDVKSAIRTIEVIELLSHHKDGLSFTEIQNLMNIPKSSLFVLLSTIQKEQWISFDVKTKCFRLGIKAWEITQRFITNLYFAKQAETHLIELRNLLNTAAHLAVLERSDVLYLAQTKADNSYDLPSDVGARLPATATALGKSLLSGLEEEEILDLYKNREFKKFTEATITGVDELLSVISQTRDQGFSESNGDFVQRFFCIASPVRDSTGKVVAAISCTTPKKDLDSKKITKARMTEAVIKEAHSLSSQLGWHS